MVNYRVRNLDVMLAQLRAAGAQVDDRVEDYDLGRFGWAISMASQCPWLRSVRLCVRRAKVFDLQQVKLLPGIWVAPAGSYRSDDGGNETVGAFETDGSLWRLSEPAGRNSQ